MHPITLSLIIGWFTGLVITEYTSWSAAQFTTIWAIPVLIVGWLIRSSQHLLYLLIAGIMCLCGSMRMDAHRHIHIPNTMMLDRTIVSVREQKNTWQHQKIIVTDQLNQHYMIQLPLHPQYYRGSTLTLSGQFVSWPNPMNDYHAQLRRQRIIGELIHTTIHHVHTHTTYMTLIEQSRVYFWRHIHSTFPEPIASVVSGMLLGMAGDVDKQTATAFRQSGTSHILVISGWNITIVAAICHAAITALKPNRTIALMAPLVFIGVYVMFTGASAAVIRAGVMGCMIVVGKWLDRPRSMYNIIALAICMITVVDPSALWDIGMQLSTLATIGLIVFGTPIEHYLSRSLLRSPHLSWSREGLASTIAAQITTFPIMVCRLDLPTIWSLLANTIITPVVPFAMASGTLFLVMTLVHPWIAQIAAWAAYPSFAWIVKGSQVLATWPSPPPLGISITAFWFELLLHACWILGWYVWHTLHRTQSTQTE